MEQNKSLKAWLLIAFCFLGVLSSHGGISPANGPANFANDDSFLDYVESQTFKYFWDEANPTNGLIPDKSSTSACSIAAVGYGLSCINIGIDRGWITRSNGAARVLTTLQTFYNLPQGTNATGVAGYRGWFYHYLDMNTGLRNGTTELSTIDTALLMLGVVDAGQFFDNPTNATEASIRLLSEQLVSRVDWQWAKRSDDTVYMHWYPDMGFSGASGWSGGNEAYLLYLLGLGVATNPLPTSSWKAWTNSYSWQTKYGYSYIFKAPLFMHQYVHCWFDLRGITDGYMRAKNSDYFEDARRATLAQQAYAIDNPGGYPNYGTNEWGLTACSGPPGLGYVARGCPSGTDDGVMAPTAAVSSIPFVPETAIPTTRHFYDQYTNLIWSTEGFRDSYSIKSNWFCGWCTSIDQGPIVMMIENYRSGRVWRRMLGSEVIQRGLERAGFTAPPPDHLKMTVVSDNQISLSWRDLSGYETGFEVQMALNDQDFLVSATVGVNVTNTLISFSPGAVYYFRVRTASGVGFSDFRETNMFYIPPAAVPATPTTVAAKAVSFNQIDLSWTGAPGASGYLITRNGVLLGEVAGTSFTDNSLMEGTTYAYAVSATNVLGSSLFSAPVFATTPMQDQALVQYTFDGEPTDPIIDTNDFGNRLAATIMVPGVAAGSIIQGGDGSNIGFRTSQTGAPAGYPYLQVLPGNAAANTSVSSGSPLTTGAAAVAANAYFTFTVEATGTNRLFLQSFTFDVAKGGSSGPRGFVIQAGDTGSGISNLVEATEVLNVRPNYTNIMVDLNGPAFQGITGITFRIFSYSGSIGSSVEYDNLVVNGVVKAIPSPSLIAQQANALQVRLEGVNGLPNATFYLFSATNLTLPTIQWTRIATNQFTPAGTFILTNPINLGFGQQFFQIETP